MSQDVLRHIVDVYRFPPTGFNGIQCIALQWFMLMILDLRNWRDSLCIIMRHSYWDKIQV